MTRTVAELELEIEYMRQEVYNLRGDNMQLVSALMAKETAPDVSVHVSENARGEKVFRADKPEQAAPLLHATIRKFDNIDPDQILQELQKANLNYHNLNLDLLKRVRIQIEMLNSLQGQVDNLTAQARLKSAASPAIPENSKAFIGSVFKKLKDENNMLTETLALLRVEYKNIFVSVKETKQKNDDLAQKNVLLHQEALEAVAEKEAGKRKAATAIAQSLKTQDKLRGELASAKLQLSAALAASDTLSEKNAALDTRVASYELANKVHCGVVADLQSTIKQQLDSTADLQQTYGEQTRALDAARQLAADAAAQKTSLLNRVGALTAEINTMKVRKITEANEHTAWLSHMLLNGQTMQPYMPQPCMPMQPCIFMPCA